MKNDYTKRIALIGAGAAGLTAAETLKGKGYQHVTIFEKESFAGGKCRTISYEGRTYELGAGIIAGNNDTILQLVKKTGVALFSSQDALKKSTKFTKIASMHEKNSTAEGRDNYICVDGRRIKNERKEVQQASGNRLG